MTWFKVCDGFHDHPKTLALIEEEHGDAAVGLWTRCGSWASDHETDGRVPGAVVRAKGGTPEKVALLVKHGLWEPDGTGYRFHDWQSSNPLKAELEAKRDQAKKRLAKHKEQKAEKDAQRVANASAPAEEKRVANALPTEGEQRDANACPDPTRPDPTRSNSPLSPQGGRVVELPDADPDAYRQPPVGGVYLAEVRDGWAEAYSAAKRGSPPRLAGQAMAAAVAFARDVARDHGKPLRDAARAIAEAALRQPGDPAWHLSRLDPYAPPRPIPGPGNGIADGERKETPDETRARLKREVAEANARARGEKVPA